MNIVVNWSPKQNADGSIDGRDHIDVLIGTNGVSRTITVKLPKTVYGGSLDISTGKGTETWGYIENYNGETIQGEWFSDLDGRFDNGMPTEGAFVVYKRASPEPFSIASQETIKINPDKDTVQVDCDNVVIFGDANPLSERVAFLEQVMVDSI